MLIRKIESILSIMQSGAVSKSSGDSVSTSITRPANTTAYTALDVFGTAATSTLTFANVGSVGDLILIPSTILKYAVNAVPSGMSSFKLHLFNAAPTAIVDNAAFNIIAADLAKYVGCINLDTPIDYGDNLISQKDTPNLTVKLVTTSLYGVLQTIGAYTPASGTVATVMLKTVTL